MQQWPLLNPPSGSSGRSCFGDVEAPDALYVGLPPNLGPASSLVRQPGGSLVFTLFLARQLLEARHAVDPALNTPEPSICPASMVPGTPTSSTLLNLRPSFLLSVGQEPIGLLNAPLSARPGVCF